MAEIAVTGLQILMKLAADVADLRGRKITTATDTTHVTCASVSDAANTYQYGLAAILGKGVSIVQSSTNVGAFVVSPAFTSAPAVGDILQLAFWRENKLGNAIAALNDMIQSFFPEWYREVVIDLNHLTDASGASVTQQTFAAGTDTYSLPADVSVLSRVLVQADATSPPTSIPRRDLWDTHGQEGNLKLRFKNNGGAFLPSNYAGLKIGLHYMAKEPLITSLSAATVQLPLDCASLAAAIYKRRFLFRDSDTDLSVDGVALPQLQIEVRAALRRVGIIKDPLPFGPVYRR
jgi:hypothetical protein